MKNSPHKREKARKKAVRNANSLYNKNLEPSDSKGSIEHPDKWFLCSYNKKKHDTILKNFIQYQKRTRRFKSLNHSKRTSPGELEDGGPYTVQPTNTKATFNTWEKKTLEANNRLSYKLQKQQNRFKKAS